MKDVVIVIQDHPNPEWMSGEPVSASNKILFNKCEWLPRFFKDYLNINQVHIDDWVYDPSKVYIHFISVMHHWAVQNHHFDFVDDRIVDAVLSGKILLVIDEMMESYHPGELTGSVEMYQVIENWIGTKNVIWSSSMNEETAKAIGLYDKFKRFVSIENFYINAFADDRFYKREFESIDFDAKKTKFVCLNGTTKEHRLLLWMEAVNRGWLGEILYSMNLKELQVNTTHDETFPQEYMEMALNMANDIVLFGNMEPNYFNMEFVIDAIRNKLPMIIDRPYGTYTGDEPLLNTIYDSTHISLCTETHFSFNLYRQHKNNPNVYTDTLNKIQNPFFTEKTFEKLVSYHPFIILGDCAINSKLEKFGLEPYYDLIIEDFDSILDPYERFKMFVKNTEALLSLPEIEIRNIVKNNSARIKRNGDHFRDSKNLSSYLRTVIMEIIK